MGDRWCSVHGWCQGSDNCPIHVDPVEALQSEVDGIEQDILDLNNEVEELSDAVAQINDELTLLVVGDTTQPDENLVGAMTQPDENCLGNFWWEYCSAKYYADDLCVD